METNYSRSYGQHDYQIAGGDVVSVVSQPSWEEFREQIHGSQSLGTIALSPELITSPMPLELIPGSRQLIEGRIEEIRQLSGDLPDTTFALGTPTFDNEFGRPANSLLFMKHGELVARRNKTFTMYPLEKSIFTMKPPNGLQAPEGHLAALVCSDLLSAGSSPSLIKSLARDSDNRSPELDVKGSAETALITSCWAIPMINDPRLDEVLPREDRFRIQLENRVRALFTRYPSLRDVVISDRTVPVSGVDDPFNCHFVRTEAGVRQPVAD
jgi:hypothetical protein